MNEIPGAWIPASLLLFGGAVTALAAGAAILLAESWFQKMRQRREHDKIWQNRQLKTWQDLQQQSFCGVNRLVQFLDNVSVIGALQS